MKKVIDISDWYCEGWVNSQELYNEVRDKFFSDFPEKKGGVYHIYKDDELLYIGTTRNFISRITEHILLNSNTKDFINDATRIECFFIEDTDEREIREYVEIRDKKPSKNKRLPRLTAYQKEVVSSYDKLSNIEKETN